MRGVVLNCNNGGGMRCLVRLCKVDSMTGVDLTNKLVDIGKQKDTGGGPQQQDHLQQCELLAEWLA